MQKCSDVSPKYVNVESWFVEVFTVNSPELRKIPDNPRKTVNQRFPDISRKSSLKNTFLTFFLPKKPARADALQQSWMAKSETFHTQSTSEKDIPVSLTACMTGKSIPQEMFPKNTSQGACLRELWYLRSVRARADGYSAEKSQRIRPYRKCPSLTTAGAYSPSPKDLFLLLFFFYLFLLSCSSFARIGSSSSNFSTTSTLSTFHFPFSLFAPHLLLEIVHQTQNSEFGAHSRLRN